MARSDRAWNFSTPGRCVPRTRLRNEISFPENQEVRPAPGGDARRVESIPKPPQDSPSGFQELGKWSGVVSILSDRKSVQTAWKQERERRDEKQTSESILAI